MDDRLLPEELAFLQIEGLALPGTEAGTQNRIYEQVVVDMDTHGHFHRGSFFLSDTALYHLDWEREGEEWPFTVEKIPVTRIDSLWVDELISTCRFSALVQGERKFLTYTTFYAKEDLYRLTDTFTKLKEGRRDEIAGEGAARRFCPQCGRRYPDRERQFCPACMDRGKVIRRMSGFFLHYKLQMAAIILIMAALSALSVITPYFTSKFLYDEVLNVSSAYYGRIVFLVLLVVGMRIARLFLNMINGIVTSRISARIVYDMKQTIFSAIERLSLGYFTARTTGGLMNQVYYDANRIYWFFTDGFPYFVINVVQLVAVTVIMIRFNPLLTLLALGLTPLVFWLIGRLFRQSRHLNRRSYTRSRALNSLLSDLLTGIRVVKTFSREKGEAQRFAKASRDLADAHRKSSRFGVTAFPLVNTLVYLGLILVWGVGGYMAIQGSFGMTYGILTMFVSYVTMVYDPLYFFVDMVEWGSDSMNSMNRLFEIMDASADVREKEDPVALPALRGDVSFENISFSYTKSRKIIDRVSFSVEAGKTLGIVGHTGSGKSTLVNLLIRLYDADEGRITVDGVDVKDLSFEDLRRNVAIVSQETYLFVGTIYDNIRYANHDATREQVIEAAKAAGAHDFIMKMPDAYSTMVGFGHKDLSGGEKQRISIARALLRNPRILILDEATAAMDTQTERRIQNTLDALSVGRTTIMIAHRLSTLRNADSLVVIDNGKVVEQGTHAGLLTKKGEYYKLYQLQLDALKNVGVTE